MCCIHFKRSWIYPRSQKITLHEISIHITNCSTYFFYFHFHPFPSVLPLPFHSSSAESAVMVAIVTFFPTITWLNLRNISRHKILIHSDTTFLTFPLPGQVGLTITSQQIICGKITNWPHQDCLCWSPLILKSLRQPSAYVPQRSQRSQQLDPWGQWDLPFHPISRVQGRLWHFYITNFSCYGVVEIETTMEERFDLE